MGRNLTDNTADDTPSSCEGMMNPEMKTFKLQV
jgi:hypothetical protein